VNEAKLDVRVSDVLGLCVASQCEFKAPLTFPESIDAGMRVGKIGRSSVRYEIALFRENGDECVATGHFVHVYQGPFETPPK
jgi:acyl-CoA thioester hydrolase